MNELLSPAHWPAQGWSPVLRRHRGDTGLCVTLLSWSVTSVVSHITVLALSWSQSYHWYYNHDKTLALKANRRSLFCYFPLGAGTQNKHLTSCHIIFVVSMQSHREMCWEPSRSVWVKVTERQWECNSSCLCLWSWIRWLWLIKFSLDIRVSNILKFFSTLDRWCILV